MKLSLWIIIRIYIIPKCALSSVVPGTVTREIMDLEASVRKEPLPTRTVSSISYMYIHRYMQY